jgi:hypothetical protein
MMTHLEETLESADRDMTPTNLSSASHGGKIEVVSSKEETIHAAHSRCLILSRSSSRPFTFLLAGFVKHVIGLGMAHASA